jgi:hypothetical protein
MLSTVLSIIAVVTGLASLWLSNTQWEKVKAKIGMIDDVGKAIEVLPAWYTGRMMTDYWAFGLVTESGKTIAIQRINAISDDGKWMDVELVKPTNRFNDQNNVLTAIADDRTSASIQIDKIVMAYELETS